MLSTRWRSQIRRIAVSGVAVASLVALSAGCKSKGEGEAPEEDEQVDEGTERDVIRFGVGPVLPTPKETREAFMPFFEHLADELGYEDFELQETTEWAGIGVALASGQVDVAWMGPWGYVLARDQNQGIHAIATVKYNDEPIYYSIIIARPDHGIENWPEDAEGMSLTLADTGSTSGWLIPMYHFQEVWDLDPEEFFSEFSEGGSHTAQKTAVVEGHVDLASDFNRHRDAMIESGAIEPDATEIVWQSDPLPNDAIAVRPELDEEVVAELQELLAGMDKAQAESLLPQNYTGFVKASHADYEMVEDAGKALGRVGN
jgi:phosphonate transport system substrate-binding protein